MLAPQPLTYCEQQRLRKLRCRIRVPCFVQEYTALLNVRDSFWQERLTGAIGLDREPSGLLFLALSEPTKPLRRFFAVRMLMCMAKTHSEVSKPACAALHSWQVIQSASWVCMHICCRALPDGPRSGSQQAEQALAPYTGCVRAYMPGLDPLQGNSPGLLHRQLS